MDINLLAEIRNRIFELSPEAILIFDNEGVVQDINSKVIKWTGYQKHEVVGKHVTEIPYINYSPESTKLVKEKFLSRVKGSNLAPYDFNIKTKEGKIFVGRVTGELIKKDDKVVGVLIMISNVDELFVAKQKLQEAIDRLEKINNLMIDRELRIKELKERIKALEH